MRILVFGALDRNYPRNRVLRIGLQRLGVSVDVCPAPQWNASLPRYAALLAAYAVRARADALLVPEFRHKDVPLARMLATLSGIPLIVDPLVSRYDTRVHDWGSTRSGSWSAGHSRRVDRSAVRFADLLLVDTPEHGDYFQKEYRVPAERCAVVPVGFDDAVFQPLPEPVARPFRIAFFGSYLPLHGIETIMDAIGKLRQHDLRVLLIGRGQTFGQVQRARARGLALEVIEHLPPRELVRRLQSVHVLLGIFGTTPKAARVVPNKVYQGLALQRALITADTPAIRSFFRAGEDLCTVPAGDADALAQTILQLRDDPELRRRIAAHGAGTVHARFNPERVAGRFLEAGQQVLGWKVGVQA